MVWNQGFPTALGGLCVKAPNTLFSSTQFRKQHSRHEKAVSRTSLSVVVCKWQYESISRGKA
ncbi:unnamed protein product [Schistosoma mattheei]|uniref:Uncharacterized protein n=1 Tax=Schistosoma mattheei TaxID=31246 RepID=A0A3P8E7P4_9TREM|nr:unnamed protein product [Schistosoma mattheei]